MMTKAVVFLTYLDYKAKYSPNTKLYFNKSKLFTRRESKILTNI